MLNQVVLPSHYNYIGVFLTLSCNLSCSYCINHLVGLNQRRKHLNGKEWVEIINKLETPGNLPISLQGGEPSIHKDFLYILKHIRNDINIDLLTNIQFNLEEFISEISPERFKRDLPYPAIRVSYHPETMNLDSTIEKVKFLHERGYSIGLFTVEHPEAIHEIPLIKKKCKEAGIIFKTKEFLGVYNDKLYGTYKFQGSVFNDKTKTVQCKTSELLISPEGYVFRCHHDLYNKKSPIGDALSPKFTIDDNYRICDYFGKCNPCDVKLKNNRFQQHGHCSVEIIE